MATIEYFKNKDILTRVRTTVETAFYGNNVVKISSPAEMYSLAKTVQEP